jgi:hypothetical protein
MKQQGLSMTKNSNFKKILAGHIEGNGITAQNMKTGQGFIGGLN